MSTPSRVVVENLQVIHSQLFSDGTDKVLRSDLTTTIQITSAIIPSMAKVLLKNIKPKAIVSLKPGEIKRIGPDLLVEKTVDGKIILYEVIE